MVSIPSGPKYARKPSKDVLDDDDWLFELSYPARPKPEAMSSTVVRELSFAGDTKHSF